MKWMTKAKMMSALAFVILNGIILCAPGLADSAISSSSKIALSSIESISTSGEGDSTELVIKLSSPATYTSYKTTAPLRLVIDLSQTTTGTITAPIIINKGNFKTVTVSRFDTDAGVLTRIDVELVKDSEAILTAMPAVPGELRLTFPSSLSGSTTIDSSSETVAPKKMVEAPPLSDIQPVTQVPAEVVKPKLTSIKTVNNSIVMELDAPVVDFKTFRLSKPERYVIDLMDVQSALTTRLLPLNSAGVASARIGLYPDKVRVVLDAVNGAFPEANAAKNESGVVITLNPKTVDDNTNTKLTATHSTEPPKTAANSGNAPHAVTKPAGPLEAKIDDLKVTNYAQTDNVNSPATVQMIDFQVVDGLSRVSVKIKGKIIADQPIKTPGFITLTVKNAILPKNLQRSLDAKSFISPVLRVTPLMVVGKTGTDTKIRIAMRTTAQFEMRQESDMLFVDIKNPAGLTADKLEIDAFDSGSKVALQAVPNSREDELLSAQEPPPVISEHRHGYKGRKVTLEFADAEVRKIFQLLSEVSNKNFVLGDDVTGTISLKLVNVPWDQALDIILETKGLDKREDGNIILIKGKGKFKTQAEEEQEIKKALTKAIELKTETFSINYADITTIASQFNGLKSDRGTISQDARTNKVIVKDIPQILNEMRKLLVQLDVPEKQVMIEARIVEASSSFTRNLGVNWGVHYRDGSASFLGINSLDTGFGGLTSAPPTSGTGSSAGGNMGISFGTLSSNIQLDMRLNAAASAGMIKIVSTPKVATLNNKTAKITQGQQIPYTSSTSDKVETKFIEAALSLEVTPHINANGTIGMKIDAKNDSPGQTTSGSTAPSINKKQAITEMLLRDGETTVIGGIYVDSDNTSDEGVPYLMDIPLLGKLFKTNNKTKTKTELLIFITPRILGSI
ncbi:MAG: type IV pilus secretin PilQ [Geobacter sp.]|nr:type IV pilus secretin PilQ [Geobacter sp.]